MRMINYKCDKCEKEWRAMNREYGMCPYCNAPIKDEPLTVRILLEYLKGFDPDIVVLERRMSDWGPMELNSWDLKDMVKVDNGAWYQETDYRTPSNRTVETVKVLRYYGN
jgi:hypothetical protein